MDMNGQDKYQSPAEGAVIPASNQPDQADDVFASQPADTEQQLEDALDEQPVVSWVGPEFVAHDKGKKWYFVLAVVSVVAAISVYLLSKDIISGGTILIVGAMLAVLGARKPKQITYQITGRGVVLGDKSYVFSQFRSFSLLTESHERSVSLYPFQRFMPLITLYYPLEYEEEIVDSLSDHLAVEDREHDLIDRFLHKIRL